MPSALSIAALTFTTISIVMFVGLCANHFGRDGMAFGYVTFIAGFVLSILSLIFRDRTWVAKLSIVLSVSLFVAASAAYAWAFRGADH